MNKEQLEAALDNLDRASSQAPGTRMDHISAQQSVQLLRQFIQQTFAPKTSTGSDVLDKK